VRETSPRWCYQWTD
jgi:hypothetical protein